MRFEDIFTFINATFGFLVLMNLFPEYNLVMISLAVIADGMDGIIARRRGGKDTKRIGVYLDALADCISFVIVPASLLIRASPKLSLFALIYLCAGIYRLGRYCYSDYDATNFRGLPAPAAALMLISAYVVLPIYLIIPIYLTVSILMASKINYLKPKGRNAYMLGAFIFICGIYSIFAQTQIPIYLLISALFLYLLSPICIRNKIAP